MPSLFALMCSELADIAWQDELDARAEHLRNSERMAEIRRKRGQTPTPVRPMVFDENKAEALDTLAYDVREDYNRWMEQRQRGEPDTTRTRKRVPEWMTWPLLFEWSQRYIRAMKTVRGGGEAEEAQDRPDV